MCADGAAPLGRRHLLEAGLAGLVAMRLGEARADRRAPVGGEIAFQVPWPLASIDPHRLDDLAAALVGGALFDSLYAYAAYPSVGASNPASAPATPSGGGNVAVLPALAEGEPVIERGEARVQLRAGLTTARERPIEASDVVASLARARAFAAAGWLAELPAPRPDGKLGLVFPVGPSSVDGAKLARCLASPLTAIVPRSFSPAQPDGTGPFRAEIRGEGVLLARNPRAALGPALLERVVVRSSDELAASLRAFESGADDLGWLGSGLHEPRAGARTFDAGPLAWAVLRTGREAQSWDAPGVAQRLCDGIAPSRLSYLGVGGSFRPEEEQGWGGPPGELVVREDAPWLVELARALAAIVSRPGHLLAVKPIAATDLVQRRATRAYALALDVVRPFAPGPLGAFLALATADDPGAIVGVARHAPRVAGLDARAFPRTMHLGIVGEIRAQGGRLAEIGLPTSPAGGFDFGMLTRARKTS